MLLNYFSIFKFLVGDTYLLWSFAGDIFGVAVIAGLIMAFWRRYKVKPSRLDTKPIDTFALVLIAFIILADFKQIAQE